MKLGGFLLTVSEQGTKLSQDAVFWLCEWLCRHNLFLHIAMHPCQCCNHYLACIPCEGVIKKEFDQLWRSCVYCHYGDDLHLLKLDWKLNMEFTWLNYVFNKPVLWLLCLQCILNLCFQYAVQLMFVYNVRWITKIDTGAQFQVLTGNMLTFDITQKMQGVVKKKMTSVEGRAYYHSPMEIIWSESYANDLWWGSECVRAHKW